MEKGFFLFYSLYSNIIFIYYIILYILRNSTTPLKLLHPTFGGGVANLGGWYMRVGSFCEFELFQLAECNLGAKTFIRVPRRAFLK